MKLKIIGPNQTEVSNGDKTVFFSYETPVAAKTIEGFFRTDYKWSPTTSKHINRWLDGREAKPKPQTFFDDLLT
jgi:hypothetical protein